MPTSLRHLRPVARVRTPAATPLPLLALLPLLLAPLVAALLFGCSAPTGSQGSEDVAAEPGNAAAGDDAGAVEYQPAFPAEVSDAPLEESDAQQQEAAHSHSEGEHSHGEDTHTHDGDSDHEHGDGGDHSH